MPGRFVTAMLTLAATVVAACSDGPPANPFRDTGLVSHSFQAPVDYVFVEDLVALEVLGAQPVWVDLDGVTSLDDTCLGMLLGAAGRAREAGGDLALVASGERLRHRFALTGLDRAVTVVATLPR